MAYQTLNFKFVGKKVLFDGTFHEKTEAVKQFAHRSHLECFPCELLSQLLRTAEESWFYGDVLANIKMEQTGWRAPKNLNPPIHACTDIFSS